MKKNDYCTQNDGDCQTCALVNYGRDCQNNPIAQGNHITLRVSCGSGKEEWVDDLGNVLAVAAESCMVGGRMRKPLGVEYPNISNPIINGRVTYACVLPDGRKAVEHQDYFGTACGYTVRDW